MICDKNTYNQLFENIKSNNVSYIEENTQKIPQIDSLLSTSDSSYIQYSLLSYACKNKQLNIVSFLISKGADISISESDDIYIYDTLYTAINNKDLQMVEILLKNKANTDTIYTEYGLTLLS